MPVTRDDVVYLYRIILGREPESEEVIGIHMQVPEFEQLRHNFITSAEFRQTVGATLGAAPAAEARPATTPLNLRPQEVEARCSDPELRRVLTETARYWEDVGQEAPHWSVVTAEEFRPGEIDANLDRFHDSARPDRDHLIATLARIGAAPSDFQGCVEFGCGVGRMTHLFAEIFPAVVGLDISRPHLAIAYREMERRGVKNVQFAQVTVQDIHPVHDYDFWYSRIVLQHNPPPVMHAVLDRALGGLVPGGVAMFQLPVWHRGYAFRVRDYLASPLGRGMEMHCLPQKEVLDLAHRHNCRVVDLREDSLVVGHPSEWLSNTFTLRKEA